MVDSDSYTRAASDQREAQYRGDGMTASVRATHLWRDLRDHLRLDYGVDDGPIVSRIAWVICEAEREAADRATGGAQIYAQEKQEDTCTPSDETGIVVDIRVGAYSVAEVARMLGAIIADIAIMRDGEGVSAGSNEYDRRGRLVTASYAIDYAASVKDVESCVFKH